MAVAAYSTFFDENTGGNAGSVALGYGFICVGSKFARKVIGYGVSAVIAGVYLVSAFKTSSRNVGGSEDVINLVDNFHMFFAAFFADFYLHTGFGTSSRDFAGSNIFMFTSCGSSFFANRIMALGAGLYRISGLAASSVYDLSSLIIMFQCGNSVDADDCAAIFASDYLAAARRASSFICDSLGIDMSRRIDNIRLFLITTFGTYLRV